MRRLVLLLTGLLACAQLAADDRSRCGTIIISPGSFLSGGSFVVKTPNFFFGFSLPSSQTVVVTPRPFFRPHAFIAPSFFCIQASSGPLSFLWCEPVDTSVVVIGRPLWWRPGFVVDPVFPFLDPPGGWHSPLVQPGFMTFRLRNRSAEEVAKLLNEARILPDGRFAGLGETLIVSAPSLLTSGVRQQRIRELVAQLDRSPGRSPTNAGDWPKTWSVEVYRIHERCPACELLKGDMGVVLASLGVEGNHLVGKAEWRWQAEPRIQLRQGDSEVTLSAQSVGNEWRVLLDGIAGGKPLRQEGPVPKVRRPVVLLARSDAGPDGLVAVLTPR